MSNPIFGAFWYVLPDKALENEQYVFWVISNTIATTKQTQNISTENIFFIQEIWAPLEEYYPVLYANWGARLTVSHFLMNTCYLEQFCDSPDIGMNRKCVWAITDFDQIVCTKNKLRKPEQND